MNVIAFYRADERINSLLFLLTQKSVFINSKIRRPQFSDLNREKGLGRGAKWTGCKIGGGAKLEGVKKCLQK